MLCFTSSYIAFVSTLHIYAFGSAQRTIIRSTVLCVYARVAQSASQLLVKPETTNLATSCVFVFFFQQSS